MTGWLRRLFADASPPGFAGPLGGDERVLGSAPVTGGGTIVVTTHGLWLPTGGTGDASAPGQGGHRLVGWHLVSKAAWDGRALTVTEADEVGQHGDAVLIADRPPRRLTLPEPARVPELVHARVTRSVLHSERDADGHLVVRRRVPGRDGVQVQIRRAGG